MMRKKLGRSIVIIHRTKKNDIRGGRGLGAKKRAIRISSDNRRWNLRRELVSNNKVVLFKSNSANQTYAGVRGIENPKKGELS